MFSKKKWKRGEDRKEGGEAVNVLYKNKFKNIFKKPTHLTRSCDPIVAEALVLTADITSCHQKVSLLPLP